MAFLPSEFGLIEMRLPLPECLDAAFKTDPADWFVLARGRLPHKTANAVIDNQVHEDFLADHVRRFATQNIHAHGRFDIPKKQFDVPPLKIQIRQLAGGIGFHIQQGRDEVKGGNSKAGLLHRHFDLPEDEDCW